MPQYPEPTANVRYGPVAPNPQSAHTLLSAPFACFFVSHLGIMRLLFPYGMEQWNMTIHHETEPAQDHPVSLSLDYALSDPEVLVGVSPEERYEEMRKQLLAGPLKDLAETKDGAPNKSDPDVHLHMDGNHHFNPNTGEISGQVLLQGIIKGHGRMTPEEMLAAARPHFEKALALDMGDGLRDNLAQHEAQEG